MLLKFRLQDCHPLWCVFPNGFGYLSQVTILTADTVKLQNPRHHNGNAVRLIHHHGLGCSQFARRYYGNRYYFLFLQVLRWFSSLSARCQTYIFCLQLHTTIVCQVPPFGYLRIYACLQLPAAFRSWPRPSSVVGAQASTLSPFLFTPNLKIHIKSFKSHMYFRTRSFIRLTVSQIN